MVDLVRALQPTPWSIFTLNLTSSYQGWGLGHLDKDTEEIAQCIRYIKEYKTAKFGNGNIVLMGHSTGSQCVLHYLSRPNPHINTSKHVPEFQYSERPAIDGAIMQAPVSDREAIHWVLHEGMGGRSPSELKATYEKIEAMARESIARDEIFDTLLPISLTSQFGYPSNTAIGCRRFLSLISPDSPASPSEDDVFSSDLSDEQLATTFGMVKKRGLLRSKLMVLISGADQAIPSWVDKNKLLSRWKDATDNGDETKIWDVGRSGLIPDASHALSNDDQAEPRKFLTNKVLGYLQELS